MPKIHTVIVLAIVSLAFGLKLLAGGVGTGGLPELLWHYRIFFVGVLLTGLGSAYYHWRRDNATLFWDRLPMTIGFMALSIL